MKKLISLFTVLVLVLMVVLSGCGTATTTTPAATTTAAKQIIIGYNAFGDTSDYSKAISTNLIAKAESLGMKILRADTAGDASTAIKNVDSFITQGANIIIDCSWNLSACEAVAKKCTEAKLPCILIDIPVSDPNAYFMGVNNEDVGNTIGAAAAKYIVEKWGGKLDWVVLAYVEAWGEAVRPRVSTIPAALKKGGVTFDEKNVVYIDPQTSDSTVVAKQLGTDFLTAHPDAKHILFVGANEASAQGLLSAVEISNRDADCVVVSNDLTDMGIANLYKDDNVWIGSCAAFPENYKDVLIPMVQDIMAGKTIDKNQYQKIGFVDRSTIADYYPNPNK